MIDSKGAAFGFDCCLASPKFRVFQQPARPAARLHINFFSRCRKRPDPADNLSQTAQFSLPSRMSSRDDISEFESSHPSHAVGSLWRVYPVHGLCEQRITDVECLRLVTSAGDVAAVLRAMRPFSRLGKIVQSLANCP